MGVRSAAEQVLSARSAPDHDAHSVFPFFAHYCPEQPVRRTDASLAV